MAEGVNVGGAAKKANLLASVGSTGLRATGGFVTEEFLKELSGVRGARTYREMADNDGTVGAILFAFNMLIRQAKWSFQAAGESPEEEDGKEFAEGVLLKDMGTALRNVVDEICTMFVHGYAPMEVIWKRRAGPNTDPRKTSRFDDGMIGIQSIVLRSQPTITRWDLDEDDGSILGVDQQPLSGNAVTIPAERLLLFRTTTVRSNPEGRSLLRNAYRSWYFKKRIEEVEGIGVERELAGLPIAYIPSEFMSADADADQKEVFKGWQKLVMNIRRDKQDGIVMPSDRDANGNLLYDFKLVSAGGARSLDTTKIVDRHDRAIATSVLADFIFLGQNAVGSFALSSDKTALFATALGGFLDTITDVFNTDLMPRLWRYNNLDPETMPTLIHGDVETPNLTELGAYIGAMSGAGAPLFPDRELENHLREVAGLPPAPEEGEDMRTPARPAPGTAAGEDEEEPEGADA